MNLFRSGTLIEQWCRDTGLYISQREADRYWVRRVDHSAVRYVTVRHLDGMNHVKLTAPLTITIPMEHEPRGLFARVLLRSSALRYSVWYLDIGQSCEGILYLYAQPPLVVMSPLTFRSIVVEMTDEVLGFEEELRGKFRWGGSFGGFASPETQAGVPAAHQADGKGIRYR